MDDSGEITIRIASPLRFIDDEGESADECGQESKQHKMVAVAKEKGNTPNDRISVGPNASNEIVVARNKSRRQPFELTIRGENTVISIQTSTSQDKKEVRNSDQEDLYALINETVREIFQAPGKEEIDKALENVAQGGTGKTRKFAMKGMWQNLSRSAKATEKSEIAKEREERYPSIVLLQDPPEEKAIEDQYPKMIMLEESNVHGGDKPKFEYRSKSLLSLPVTGRREFFPVFNDIALEQQSIAMEKSYLEKEKKSLEEERKGLEKGKVMLEKEKKSLERGKSFIQQDKQILHEKRLVMEQEKVTSENPQCDYNFLNKEKLCLAMEKQLLDDEKKMIFEEHDLLEKEKEILAKERNILGDEKSVLEEEKVILDKEQFVLEKQKSFFDEMRGRDEERSGESIGKCSDEFLSEIEGVFEDSLKYCGDNRLRYKQNPSKQCNFSNHYPVYVPVYSLPRPQSSLCRACHHPVQKQLPKRTKAIQTQTEQLNSHDLSPSQRDPQPDVAELPFGLLSGLFPRVVITNMKTLSTEGGQFYSGGKISEISPEEQRKPTPLGAAKGKKREKVRIPEKKVNVGSTLKLPVGDLTLKADCLAGKRREESLDEPQTDESGIETLTSENQARDELFLQADETMSIDTLHFGNPDDFYGNESKLPKAVSQEQRCNTLPLTQVGHSMYEKLTQLSLDPEPTSTEFQPAAESKEKDGEDQRANTPNVNITVTLMGDKCLTLDISPSLCLQIATLTRSSAKELPFEDADDNSKIVPRSALWYTDHPRRPPPRPEDWQTPIHLTVSPTEEKHSTKKINVRLLANENARVGLRTNAEDGMTIDFSSQQINLKEAKVGTDDYLAGGNYVGYQANEEIMSPKVSVLLQKLHRKLESVGNEKKQSSLYLVKEIASPPLQKQKVQYRRPITCNRTTPVTREYFCEQCLATMRLYEDEFLSVQNIVDKFEALNKRSN